MQLLITGTAVDLSQIISQYYGPESVNLLPQGSIRFRTDKQINLFASNYEWGLCYGYADVLRKRYQRSL